MQSTVNISIDHKKQVDTIYINFAKAFNKLHHAVIFIKTTTFEIIKVLQLMMLLYQMILKC